MSELRRLTAALTWQKRRLNELVELSGSLDSEHPLQRFSLRRIEWLERKIETMKQLNKEETICQIRITK